MATVETRDRQIASDLAAAEAAPLDEEPPTEERDRLRAEVAGHVQARVSRAGADLEQSGLTTWALGELPRTVTSGRGQRQVVGYPTIVDDGDSVSLRPHDTPEEAVRGFMQIVQYRRNQELLMQVPPSLPRALITGVPSAVPTPAVERLSSTQSASSSGSAGDSSGMSAP